MRKAISVVLAALLLILPVEQVLAQAVQQGAVSVQQTPPSDGAASLFRVPPLTENSARLLGTTSDRALQDTPIADALLVQENNGEGWAWGWIVFISAGVAVGLYYIARAFFVDLGGPRSGQP